MFSYIFKIVMCALYSNILLDMFPGPTPNTTFAPETYLHGLHQAVPVNHIKAHGF